MKKPKIFTDATGNGKLIVVKDGRADITFTKKKHPTRNMVQKEFEAIQRAVELYGRDIEIFCDNQGAIKRAINQGLNCKYIPSEQNPADNFKYKDFTQ